MPGIALATNATSATFRQWRTPAEYQKSLERLVRNLKIEAAT
jgi:hypothetical protein